MNISPQINPWYPDTPEPSYISYEEFCRRAVSFDVETWLIAPGRLAPPLVCGSVGRIVNGRGVGRLLDKEQTRETFLRLLNSDAILVGANIPYDMLVMACDFAERGIDIYPLIFRAYRQGRVFDLQISEPLHAIANGHLNATPNGMPLQDPITGKPGRYSLAMVVWLVLGRKDAKQNDRWRLSYALLDGVPVELWPPDARQYPVDDAVNTIEAGAEQVARNDNLHEIIPQCFSHWALHLGAAWGMCPDPAAVEALIARTIEVRAGEEMYFLGTGFFSEVIDKGDKRLKKNTLKIKELMAIAYGADPLSQCETCSGTKKAPSPKTGKPIQCWACSATGLDLVGVMYPGTPTDGTVLNAAEGLEGEPLRIKRAIQTGRDALNESGDEELARFAALGETDKILTTYVPWMQKGITPDGEGMPINLRPNPLLDTGRTSYGDVVQLLPRGGGVRECLEAIRGWLLWSIDYGGGELVTHAQNCLWTVGWSKMAESINSGLKIHDLLGAQMIGITYEEMLERKLDVKLYSDARQAAKPGNFGFPGGMGAARLVLQQRIQGPDTTAPDGTVYKGLRFCLLIGNEEQCGHTKVTEWGSKKNPMQITPTCKRCIECADELRDTWFQLFPENRLYFKGITQIVEGDGYVYQHVSKRKRAGLTFCSAANGYFQALLADIKKHALCQVAEEQFCRRPALGGDWPGLPDGAPSPLYGSRTILDAHDELFGTSLEPEAAAAAQRVADVMLRSAALYCPDVKMEAEPALMRRWYKGADTVYEEGRLVPWEPA